MNSDFWLRLALALLVIMGIWNAFAPDMILGKVGNWLEKYPWIGKPLGLCPPCMASFHGCWIWFVTGGEWQGVFIFILALSGLMVLTVRNLLKNDG